MRNVFVDEIIKLGSSDLCVVLFLGDIGNKLFDKFKVVNGMCFFNCGIVEVNMMGVVVGMVLFGLWLVIYIIMLFIIMCCFEQICVDVCYYNVLVIIVGIGFGLFYVELGLIYYFCEDLVIMWVLFNMMVFVLVDEVELCQCLCVVFKFDGLVYICIGKKGEQIVFKQDEYFEIGCVIYVCSGSDVCLIGVGILLFIVMVVVDLLQVCGILVCVESFYIIKLFDEVSLEQVFVGYVVVGVVEEYSCIGGLGGVIVEWLVWQEFMKGCLFGFGVDDSFMYEIGLQEYVCVKYGLIVDNIVVKVEVVFWKMVG